jgi:catalase-peroxidase
VSEHGSESENPVISAPTVKETRPRTNQDWWPNQLNLQVLRQHASRPHPLGEDYDYAEAFKTLDLEELRRDVPEVMTT